MEQNQIGMKINLLSGTVIDLENIDLSKLTINDIALGLCREPRYVGQTRKGPLTVGQHILLGLGLFKTECIHNRDFKKYIDYGLEFHLHDAPEMISGDVPTQVKRWIGQAWYDKENILHQKFNERFNLKSDENTLRIIKHYDLMALAFELKYFTYNCEKRDDLPQIKYDMPDIFKTIMDEKECYDLFIKEFYELENARKIIV